MHPGCCAGGIVGHGLYDADDALLNIAEVQAQGTVFLHALLGHGVHGALGRVIYGHVLLHIHASAAYRDDKPARLQVTVSFGHCVVVDLPLG